jgi:hypothetical protein
VKEAYQVIADRVTVFTGVVSLRQMQDGSDTHNHLLLQLPVFVMFWANLPVEMQRFLELVVP